MSMQPIAVTITSEVYTDGSAAALCSVCGPLHDGAVPLTTLLGRVKAHTSLHAAAAAQGFAPEHVRDLAHARTML